MRAASHASGWCIKSEFKMVLELKNKKKLSKHQLYLLQARMTSDESKKQLVPKDIYDFLQLEPVFFECRHLLDF